MFIWGVVGGRCDIIRKKIRMKVEQRDRKLESGGSCWGKNFKNMDFLCTQDCCNVSNRKLTELELKGKKTRITLRYRGG